MEALRVRAIANSDPVGIGLSLDDFELGLAVPAVETGTLNRSAAILIRAGFSSRLAAIKAVQDASGEFHNGTELADWLNSELVTQLSSSDDWPTNETSKSWREFRNNYAPRATRKWRKSTMAVPVNWNKAIGPISVGLPVRLQNKTVLAPDLTELGVVLQPLNHARCGLALATVGPDTAHIEITYLGPDDNSKLNI